VVRLPREPGKRESRYAHLFSGEISGADELAGMVGEDDPPAQSDGRLGQLEARVATLEAEVAALRTLIDDLTAA
jgi:uncharacterized protein YceH (UPF0502 family)